MVKQQKGNRSTSILVHRVRHLRQTSELKQTFGKRRKMAIETKFETNESKFKMTKDHDRQERPRLSVDGIQALFRICTGIVFASWLPLTKATFSISRCCTLAVRLGDFELYYNESYPWQVCNFNEDISYSNNITYPSIMKPMSWAKEYCRGHQLSTLDQWLSPLSTYISPYIGLLLICPRGELTTDATRWQKWVKTLQEYMSILGDPASATFGAFHEVWSDVQTMRKLSIDGDRDLSWIQRRALWVAALTGDIKFTEHTNWTDTVLNAATILKDQTSDDKLKGKLASGQAIEADPKHLGQVNQTDDIEVETGHSAALIESRPSTAADVLDDAIEITLEARASFSGGVLIPVLLMLAVTAATFFDTYSALGDKDKALALAYCVWYSWILVVSVGGNCFATSINSDLARKAFGKVLNLNKEGSVALRDRYVNNQKWDAWAEHGDRTEFHLKSKLELMGSSWGTWLWFALGQFVGCLSVAFASACGVAIAWTTPTVGLGCRSFNFILYAGFAFLIAYLQVLRSWLSIRWEARDVPNVPNVPDEEERTKEKRPMLLRTVDAVYWFLVFVNSLVLVLGTLFHLVGVFRTCWCERLTWSDSTLIELNSKTAEAVDNARKYWISTSYVAFGVEWLLCLIAIAGRRYIVLKMEQWPVSGDRVEGDPSTVPKLEKSA